MADRGVIPGLRRLKGDDLIIGGVLRGHLRDRTGRILIRRGQRLSEDHVRLLAERETRGVYGGSDWPPAEDSDGTRATASPEELMFALNRRFRSRQDTGRVRRYARHPWRMRLKITLQENCDGVVYRLELMVTTCDVSANGFSFICKRFVHPAVILYSRFDTLPNRPVVKGIVRNCVYLESRDHRVGVEFLEPDPGERLPRV